jgi:uroporphyrinogen-III synthase
VSPRPLTGVTVAVTRATDQASALIDRLTALGAEVVAVPTIEVVGPADGGAALARALGGLDDVDWLVVTSPNGARRACAVAPDLSERLGRSGTRLAVIGPGTHAELERHGVSADLVPDRFVAEGLLDVFPAPSRPGARVLLAQAAGARPVLGHGLRSRGWTVDTIEAYRTMNPEVPTELAERARAADVVTFTSASTVAGYTAGVGLIPPPSAVVCIGPVTAEAAVAAGIHVDAVAEPHTIDGVVDAVVSLMGEDR